MKIIYGLLLTMNVMMMCEAQVIQEKETKLVELLDESDVVDMVESAEEAGIIPRLVGRGDLEGYFTLRFFWKVKDLLAQKYPSYVSKNVTFGKTIQGRDMNGFYLGRDVNVDAKVQKKVLILLDSSHHARELISFSMIMTSMIKELARIVRRSDRGVYDTVALLVLPVVNVDGVTHINEDLQKWKEKRKNFRNTMCADEVNGGVDINRNYDVSFKSEDGVGLDRCGEEYHGDKPFSEPESQAVRQLLDENPNVLSALNFHSWGNLWVHPYNYLKVGEACCTMSEKQPELWKLYDHFKSNSIFPDKVSIGPARDVVGYSTSGEASDWMALNRSIMAWSPELGIKKDNDEFITSTKEQREVISAHYPTVLDFINRHDINLRVIDQSLERNTSTLLLVLYNEGYGKYSDLSFHIKIDEKVITMKPSSTMVDRLGNVNISLVIAEPSHLYNIMKGQFYVQFANGLQRQIHISDQKMTELSQAVGVYASIGNRAVERIIYIILTLLILVSCCSLLLPKILKQAMKRKERKLRELNEDERTEISIKK